MLKCTYIVKTDCRSINLRSGVILCSGRYSTEIWILVVSPWDGRSSSYLIFSAVIVDVDSPTHRIWASMNPISLRSHQLDVKLVRVGASANLSLSPHPCGFFSGTHSRWRIAPTLSVSVRRCFGVEGCSQACPVTTDLLTYSLFFGNAEEELVTKCRTTPVVA